MSTPLSKKLRGRMKGDDPKMSGRNRNDVAQYTALHWSLYQAQVALYDTQLELDKQSDCPNNHSFRAGFKTDEEGRIVGIETNLHIDPDGRVVCRLCRNERGLAYRQQIADEDRDGS